MFSFQDFVLTVHFDTFIGQWLTILPRSRYWSLTVGLSDTGWWIKIVKGMFLNVWRILFFARLLSHFAFRSVYKVSLCAWIREQACISHVIKPHARRVKFAQVIISEVMIFCWCWLFASPSFMNMTSVYIRDLRLYTIFFCYRHLVRRGVNQASQKLPIYELFNRLGLFNK